MKVTPLAQGTGVPAQSGNSIGQTASPDKMERAKSIASGQTPVERPQTGDAQVDRIQAKRIKMKTNASTNRHEVQAEVQVAEEVDPTTQVPTIDTNEPASVPEETRPLSPQFAALAKAKRALQVKEREIMQREEALRSQNPAGNGEFISKADLLANPMSVFDVLSYDQLTEAILTNQNGQTFDPKTIDALVEKKLNERLEKEFGSRDSQAEQQVLADIKREAVQLVTQDEQFEAIRQARAADTVVDLIHRTWKKTGEVLDVNEAAVLVENQLIDEALPFAKLKAVQSRITPAQERFVEKILERTPKPGTKIMRTLTNRDSATPVMDKRQRAIAAMQGTLKRG